MLGYDMSVEERFMLLDFDRHGLDGREEAWCVVDDAQVGSDGERLIVGTYRDRETAAAVRDALVHCWTGIAYWGDAPADRGLNSADVSLVQRALESHLHALLDGNPEIARVEDLSRRLRGAVGVNVCVTNELARVAGLIANEHPDRSIQIEWRESSDEREWFILASDGSNDTVYVVDDESGTWMPLSAEELARYDRGESVLGDATERNIAEAEAINRAAGTYDDADDVLDGERG